jgi:hypothetical protein
LLDAEGDILAYERRHGAERLIVVLNLGEQPQRFTLPDSSHRYKPLLSTVANTARSRDGVLHVDANEGVILVAG